MARRRGLPTPAGDPRTRLRTLKRAENQCQIENKRRAEANRLAAAGKVNEARRLLRLPPLPHAGDA